MGDVRDKDRSGIQDSNRVIEDSAGEQGGGDTGGVLKKESTSKECSKGQMKRGGSMHSI